MSEVLEGIQELTGDSLRTVATYADDGYEFHYARDDISARINHLAEDIHKDLIIEGIGRDYMEDLFDAGSLRCSMHRFDDLSAFHFVGKDYTGLFVSIDSDANVPLQEFSQLCRKLLEEVT